MLLPPESPKRLSVGIQQCESSKLRTPTIQSGLALGLPYQKSKSDHSSSLAFATGLLGLLAWSCLGRTDRLMKPDPALLTFFQPLIQYSVPSILIEPFMSGCFSSSFLSFLKSEPLFVLSKSAIFCLFKCGACWCIQLIV